MLCSHWNSALTITKQQQQHHAFVQHRLCIFMTQLRVFQRLQLTKCLWKRNFQWRYERKWVILQFLHRGRCQWTKTYIIKMTNSVLSRQTSQVKRKTREAGGKSKHIYIYIYNSRDLVLSFFLFFYLFLYMYICNHLFCAVKEIIIIHKKDLHKHTHLWHKNSISLLCSGWHTK